MFGKNLKYAEACINRYSPSDAESVNKLKFILHGIALNYKHHWYDNALLNDMGDGGGDWRDCEGYWGFLRRYRVFWGRLAAFVGYGGYIGYCEGYLGLWGRYRGF